MKKHLLDESLHAEQALKTHNLLKAPFDDLMRIFVESEVFASQKVDFSRFSAL